MKRMQWVAAVLVVSTSWVGRSDAQTAISAGGMIESTSGGFGFPDGTAQATASQPPFVLVDSNETVVGTVLRVEEQQALVMYEAPGGRVVLTADPDRLYGSSVLVYETSDCTETAYLFELSQTTNGGQLELRPVFFPPSALRESTLYGRMSGAAPVEITVLSSWGHFGECQDHSFFPQPEIATEAAIMQASFGFTPDFSIQGGGL